MILMKYAIHDLYNLFCAACVRSKPELPLMYYSKEGMISYIVPEHELSVILTGLAEEKLSLYGELVKASEREQEMLLFELVIALCIACEAYLKIN